MKSRFVQSLMGRVHFCALVYGYVYRFAVYVYGFIAAEHEIQQ